MYPCLNQRNGGPFSNNRTPWWLMKHRTNEKNKPTHMTNTKKLKQNHSESNSENEIITEFPRFIVIKSLEEIPLTKLFPFLIEKIISKTANS